MSYVYYFFGHIISKPMHWFDFWWLYPAYNKLMIKSYEIQERTGNGPWK